MAAGKRERSRGSERVLEVCNRRWRETERERERERERDRERGREKFGGWKETKA